MGQLEDMAMYVRIVDAGSISKASEQLSVAKSAVSRRLADLEKRLDTKLMHRTTRSSSLTDAGLQYYERCKNILDEVSELNECTSGNKARVEGTLKISAPLSFGLMHLQPLLDEYASANEGLKLYVDFTDRHIDLVEEGYELAIRIGRLPDSSYQARQLTPIKHLLCASPRYLKRHGEPTTPDQLSKHAFLQYGFTAENRIQLTDTEGHVHKVLVEPKIKANNGDFLRNMAVQGHGVCYLPSFLTYKEILSGQLVSLLDHFEMPQMYAYAVYPRNRFLPERCRQFIDFLSTKFGERPYWDAPELGK